jgi:hypothetical protein
VSERVRLFGGYRCSEYSDPFTINFGTNNEGTFKVEWKPERIKEETDPYSVGVFLEFVSGKTPWKVKFSFSIIKRKEDFEANLDFQRSSGLIDQEKWKRSKSYGFYNFLRFLRIQQRSSLHLRIFWTKKYILI